MPSATDRLEFAPPPSKGSPRAYALAVLVHLLLIAALTWGVNWKRSDDSASFEAELWTSVPQQAAPRLVEVTSPAPVPAPTPAPTAPPPPPPPPPPPRAPEIKASPLVPDVDIALEQEKKRKLQQQLKQAEAQKAKKAEELQEKRDAELQAKKEKELEKKKEKELKAKEDLAAHKAQEEARKAEAKKQEARDQEKQALAAAAAAEKQKSAAAAAAKQKLAAAAAEKSRQDNINRFMGMTGAAGAKGSAKSSSGPSAGYAGKIRAKVLPNVVFTDDIVGNPEAEVEVRTTADGTILSQRLTKSSGNKAWDDAVIKAIVKTGAMPRDVDGRVPTPMTVVFKPRG